MTQQTNIPAPRWLVYLRLDQLTPALANPKKHHMPGLISSLERYGWTEPVLVDERTQRMVAGHGRRAAAIEMKGVGDPPPKGVLVDDDGEWLVPVTRGWSSRDDTEAAAYLIVDNMLPESGGWDDFELAAMLEDIHAVDATLFETLTLTTEELDELFRAYREDEDPDAPAAPAAAASDDDEDGEDGSAPDAAGERSIREVECPDCGHHFIPGAL